VNYPAKNVPNNGQTRENKPADNCFLFNMEL